MKVCCCSVAYDFLFKIKVILKVIGSDLRKETWSVNAILLISSIGVVASMPWWASFSCVLISIIFLFLHYRYIPLRKAIEVYADWMLSESFDRPAGEKENLEFCISQIFPSRVIIKIEGKEAPPLKVFGEEPPSTERREIALEEIRSLHFDKKNLMLFKESEDSNKEKDICYTNLSLDMNEFCKKYQEYQPR